MISLKKMERKKPRAEMERAIANWDVVEIPADTKIRLKRFCFKNRLSMCRVVAVLVDDFIDQRSPKKQEVPQ